MNPPLISVIMPAFNAEKYIQQAVGSVINQTFRNWELIIIDDGSIDNTWSIMEGYAKTDHRIKVIRQTNKKQAAARNAGIKISTGEWIGFIDADDEWVDRKLETQVADMAKADVLFCNGNILKESDSSVRPYPAVTGFYSGKDMYKMLFYKNPLPNLAILVKRSVVTKAGYQSEILELTGCEDWEYWLRLSAMGATFFGNEESLFIYRIHSTNTSNNDLRMKIAETYAIYQTLHGEYISKLEIVNRFNSLIEPSISALLVRNDKSQALKLLRILKDISPSLRKSVSYLFLKYLAPLPGKYLVGFIYPGQHLRYFKKMQSVNADN